MGILWEPCIRSQIHHLHQSFLWKSFGNLCRGSHIICTKIFHENPLETFIEDFTYIICSTSKSIWKVFKISASFEMGRHKFFQIIILFQGLLQYNFIRIGYLEKKLLHRNHSDSFKMTAKFLWQSYLSQKKFNKDTRNKTIQNNKYSLQYF